MNETELVKASRKMSYALRHHPEKMHLDMDRHGWVSVEQMIESMHVYFPSFSKEDMDYVVENNDKHRFSYNEDETKIRANQGHSIDVDVQMKEMMPPDILYHGTGRKYVSSIKEKGLLPMSRLYVHLSVDPSTAYKVGSRHGTPYIFMIDAKKMHKDGYHFYISENGVWQVKHVPAEYLKGE